MIVKYSFGALSVPVELVDGAGNIVPDAGIAFELNGGLKGLRVTHIHVKAIRKNTNQPVGGVAILPDPVV